MSVLDSVASGLAVISNVLSAPWKGKKIARFTKRSLFSVKKHNEIVGCLNPFLSLSVRRGGSDAFFIADENAIIQIKRDASSTDDASAAKVRLFQIVGWDAAVDGLKVRLNCKSFLPDGVTVETASGIMVALPIELRTRPDAGAVLSRDYLFNDFIFAVRPYSGTRDTDLFANPVEWIDLNNEGRKWAHWVHYKDYNNACAPMKLLVPSGTPVSDA